MAELIVSLDGSSEAVEVPPVKSRGIFAIGGGGRSLWRYDIQLAVGSREFSGDIIPIIL